MASVDDVINSLVNTKLSPHGVSFQGHSLKLNNAEDAKIVVDAINACQDLQFLNLEGNTLGVEAAEAIAKALEKQPKFKRALWKDMFTGRMKTEIPKALQYLGDGLVTAGTHLTELDLSDNAFGPIGVEGLATFLRSSSCYTLEELRLNNNGLGITGGKLLAEALLDCYNSSEAAGKSLALRVFVAGRNRLENEGATALANVFKKLGSLEEIVMPQNGIYHIGVTALSESFSYNKNLQILNLNDNTLGPKGAAAIAKILPSLTKLKQINFGDCLIKTHGAISLATGLGNNDQLEELIVGFNEIHTQGGLALVDAISNKKNLRTIILDGNQFNASGRKQIESKLKEIGKYNTLGSLEECESEEEEEGKEDEESDESEEIDCEECNNEIFIVPTACLVSDFIKNPTANNFMGLGKDRINLLLAAVRKTPGLFLYNIMPVLMKVSALTIYPQKEVANAAFKCSEKLYNQLFMSLITNRELSLANNALLVHLGLLKDENKAFKPTWNLKGCLHALAKIITLHHIPDPTKNVLQIFLEKDIDKYADLIESKQNLLQLLE